MTSSTGRRAAQALTTELPTCARLWTFQDVSAFLGVPIGTLYLWRTRGKGPPAFKLGGHVRFDPDRVRLAVESAA